MCDSHDRRLQESAPKKNPALTPKPKRTRRHVSVSYPITLDSRCAWNGVFGGAWNLETESVTAEQNHAGNAKPLQTRHLRCMESRPSALQRLVRRWEDGSRTTSPGGGSFTSTSQWELWHS